MERNEGSGVLDVRILIKGLYEQINGSNRALAGFQHRPLPLIVCKLGSRIE